MEESEVLAGEVFISIAKKDAMVRGKYREKQRRLDSWVIPKLLNEKKKYL